MLPPCKLTLAVAVLGAWPFVASPRAAAPAAPAANAANAAPSPASVLLGPPAICHPLDIGDACSLPWGGSNGWLERDGDYDVANVVDDTLEILAGTDRAMVHMETIRRATIYLSGMGKMFKPKSESWRKGEAKRLHTALKAAAMRIDAGADPSGKALAMFDVGYLTAAFDQSGLWPDATEMAWISKAIDLRPDDGGMRLGAVLASFRDHTPNPTTWRHLDKAVALAEDRSTALHRNLVSTMKHFLQVDGYDELAARVRERKLG